MNHQFHERSFGFRHGRGAHDALRIVEQKLQEGYVYVVEADWKGYFDTIPKDGLMKLLKERVSDTRLLQLIQSFLDRKILEELREWTPNAGVPQGAVLSPVLSNLYLNPLDHKMADRGFEMVRYADDFVVLCRSESEAVSALAMIRNWVEAAGLTLLVCGRPTIVSDNPIRDTTDRRALCGKTARTVRGGESPAQPEFPTPIGLATGGYGGRTGTVWQLILSSRIRGTNLKRLLCWAARLFLAF